MIIEHEGKKPVIDPSAYIAPNAVISGDVTIGPDSRILYGAVITSEGAPVKIGRGVVVMENAVIRGAGGAKQAFPCILEDYVLVGPTAYISGATLEYRAFIGANATVFNGSVVGRNAAVSLGAIVHIQTHLPAETLVPIQHIVIGNPCKLFSPNQAHEVIDELMRRNFREYVFNLKDNEVLAERYAKSLASHLSDKTLSLNDVLAAVNTTNTANTTEIAKNEAKPVRTSSRKKRAN
ncbi:MAG: gamma carbonic anhydrase family protein [Blastocatellia bacterium]|nr:gamma carbonic anhydrase family protein [Blastocatellia bacterium]MBL8195529.1 gamma carbonic anhydrase family protein [Blastocatellia bacterium]